MPWIECIFDHDNANFPPPPPAPQPRIDRADLLLLAASAAFAINAPDEEVKVRKLTAEEILEITVNKTWVVDFDNMALTATTFYKDTGERLPSVRAMLSGCNGLWTKPTTVAAVQSSFGIRCGLIVSFDETVKICMRLEPLGDWQLYRRAD